MTRTWALVVVLAIGTTAASGCLWHRPHRPPHRPPGTTPGVTVDVGPVIDPGDGGNYHPNMDPSRYVAGITNPYFPAKPGTKWTYSGTTDGEKERIEVVVTGETREILGISTTVVRDTVYHGSKTFEDTIDWYAQDVDGNVWYFGEDVKEYPDGEPVSTQGSWEAGVDGALPGIVMPAVPQAGKAYRQEYYKGEAEDMMQFTATGQFVRVPAGFYGSVAVATEWNPLEAKVVERKSFARGVGMVRKETLAGGTGVSELVDYTPGH